MKTWTFYSEPFSSLEQALLFVIVICKLQNNKTDNGFYVNVKVCLVEHYFPNSVLATLLYCVYLNYKAYL